MSNKITLDDIRAAAEAQYGALEIEVGGTTVRLLNLLRLSRKNRDALVAVQDKLSADGADQEALLKEAITLVAETPAQARALLKEVGDDLAVLATIFQRYVEGTQAGEASGSRD